LYLIELVRVEYANEVEAAKRPRVAASATFHLQPSTEANQVRSRANVLGGHTDGVGRPERFVNIANRRMSAFDPLRTNPSKLFSTPMNQGRLRALASATVTIMTVSLLQWPAATAAAPTAVAPVKSEKEACDLTKTTVAARDHFPVSKVAFCDIVVPEAQPKGYYVLALHSNRKCDGICSTHMGWYGVEKATRRVYEWDINEDKPTARVKARP
jgi:hypothetical protein